MDSNKMPVKTIIKILDGRASYNETKEYMNQIEKDSGSKQEHLRIQKIWNESENARIFGKVNILADWEDVKSGISKNLVLRSRRIPAHVFILRIAAVFLLAFGITFAFYKVFTIQKTESVKFYTYQAEQNIEKLTLPDGSVIHINVGSSLTYRGDFNHKSRDVILEGEGLFDVVANMELPFRVYTGESMVEVMGTTFSIYENEGIIKVAVMEGTVKLSSLDNTNKQINISSNQSGFMLPNKELKIKNGIDANNISWKTGLLIFDETPLDSALIDIAHYFRKNLSIETEISEKVTAEFEHQPLGEILGELEQVAGLVFDTTGGSLIVRR